MVELNEDFLLPDGRKAEIFSLQNDAGHELAVTNFGGIIHRWLAPDRSGKREDVLLGCAEWQDYTQTHPYFGAIVGRYANRIGQAKFLLDGREIRVSPNFPPHQLHGGFVGFDKKLWQATQADTPAGPSLQLSTLSEDGEEGYPGTLEVKVTYTLMQCGELLIEYQAMSDKDTVINLTSHPYFNLSGGLQPDILQHEAQIFADSVTETDHDIIPTGLFVDIRNTPLDFRRRKPIGRDIEAGEASMQIAAGYDHNYILGQHAWTEAVAIVEEAVSGRRLSVFTDQPGLQFYTGNWLAGVMGKSGMYCKHAGFCLETQHFPDSPNHEEFPSTLLRAGELWQSKTCYKIDLMTDGPVRLSF